MYLLFLGHVIVAADHLMVIFGEIELSLSGFGFGANSNSFKYTQNMQ